MSNFSNYLEGKIADWLKGTNMPAAPTTYLGLWNGTPGEAGTSGTEVSGTISARQSITWGTISSASISNSAAVDFGTSGGSATANAFGIMDALTSGNLLAYNTMTSKSIGSGDDVEVAIGNLDLALTGDFETYMSNWILNWFKGTTAPSAPAGLYVSLWDGDPNGAGSDVTTTIRAAGRVAVTLGTVSDGVVSNSVEIDFGNADAGATVSYFQIHDAASGGNALATAAVTATKTITAGDPVKWSVGALSITIA
jgi:hypothetical protein